MRLFEAIIEANHKAIAGDQDAGLRPAEFAEQLPIIALTCVDSRLNPLLPEVLGVPEDQFIWLRNAGNVITSSLSSTMRSLALACAVKGGKEIAVIGHTDCQIGKATAAQLLDKLKALGIERRLLPENIVEYFGMFGSERQNVIKACGYVRQSPLISSRIPVHGLLVDIQTGQLEWIVNGYETLTTMSDKWNEVVKSAGDTVDALKSMADFKIGEMKFPETKIGETVGKAEDWLKQTIGSLEIKPPAPGQPPSKLQTAVNVAERIVDVTEKYWPKPEEKPAKSPAAPPKLPLPPPIRPRMRMKRGDK